MKKNSWDDYPHLLADLDMSKNTNHKLYGKSIDVLDLTPGTSKKLDWKCITCEHEWKGNGDNRVRGGNGCPACVNKVIHKDGQNSMAMTHSDLASEYQGDATKVLAGTNSKLDWKCSTCEHEWQAFGNNRVKGSGCPACAGQRLHSDGRNSMYNTHPQLAKEYQGEANLIIAGTNKKLDWKCITCEHEWKTMGSHRVNGKGCPACANSGYDPSQIGYVYIHQYIDETNHWLKCGITGKPTDRFKQLSRAASRVNIEVEQLDIYTFDDGWIAQQCEQELLNSLELRFNSEYDIEGKAEFFKYSALEEIKNIIEKYL
jgi:Zn finger protein HypA/HybF involved in hydrogenase expression